MEKILLYISSVEYHEENKVIMYNLFFRKFSTNNFYFYTAIGSNNKLYKIMLLICNMHFVPVITIDVINKKDVVNIWMCCAAAPTVFWYHVYGSYRDELYNKDQMSLNDFLTLIIGLMLI